MKEPIKKVDKNAVSLVRTNSHCKEEVVVHIQQKFPLLHPYFYLCPTALDIFASGTHVNHRDEY